MQQYSLTSFLATVPDFRRSQGIRYPLGVTLLMIIMSIINGAKGYREMARFMENHADALITTLKLKHGVPSHVSVRSILLGVDLEAFNIAFFNWMEGILSDSNNKWISLDGKSIRSTLNHGGSELQNFVQVVNVFAHHSQLVVTQQDFMSSKAEEPIVVRNLIQQLDGKGLYICLDALHCQKKTLETILATKNHFLIQVKANTSRLFKECQEVTQCQEQCIDTHFSREEVNGRIDCRMVEVFEVKQGQIAKDWKGISRVIRVNRWDEAQLGKDRKSRRSRNYKKNKPTNGVHYYIIDTPINKAAFIAKPIREHWWIENKLHWKKDLYLKEDQMTIIDPQASPMVAALNNIVMNAIRMTGIEPTKAFFERIINNIQEIFRIFRT